VVAMFIVGNGVARTSVLLLIPCGAIYGLSVWWFGRTLDPA
jgi:hypothetical protein